MDKDIFDNRLLFYGLDDFYIRRIQIKAIFMCKNIKDQYLYKLYLYSRPFISETWKDNMWDYLQSDIQEFEFKEQFLLYKRKHRYK